MKRVFVSLLCVVLPVCIFSACTSGPVVTYEYPTSEAASAEPVSENSDFPVLAKTDDGNVRLYGISPSGAVLYVGDDGRYIDLKFKPGSSPKIFTGKFDGEFNIAVFADTENGSGEYAGRLYFLGNNINSRVVEVEISDFEGTVSSYVQYENTGENITFSVGDKNYSFDMSECFEKYEFAGVDYCSNADVVCENGSLYLLLTPCVKSGNGENGIAGVDIDLTVRAKVIFTENGIIVGDVDITGL